MTDLEYKVFHGVGAIITEIKGNTVFSVVGMMTDASHIDFANVDHLRFSVEMARTPSRLKSARWKDILIDDRGIDSAGKELSLDPQPMKFPLAMTSIGSGSLDYPPKGAFVGAVYLERAYYLSIRDTKLSGWPNNPGDFTLQQLTSIAYSCNPLNGERAGKRYHGFLATVTKIEDSHVTVAVTERGETKTVTLVANDPNAYDPDPPAEAIGSDGSLVSLAKNLKMGESGALFIELRTAVQADLQGPKLPIGEGG